MKKERRGGPGRNQGLRKDTYKNAQKPPESRHSVKKYVSYTPDEWKTVQAKIERLNMKNFTEYARGATLNYEPEA